MIALLLLTLSVTAAPNVTVTEARGTYTVAARFDVPQPPAVALAVLTDYASIPRFMPDIRTSVVREQAGGRSIVEQEAVSKMLMFSKRVHLVLEVHAGPDSIVFRDTCGKSFAQYHGQWRLAEQNGGTTITYELTARPAFDVPEFLLKRLLKRDAGTMIDRLRQEIERRQP